MTNVKIPYNPRKWQLDAVNNLKRFTVLVMHRRAGKTVFDVVNNIFNVLSSPNPRPQGAYIAPNYGMAKKIAWDYYKEFLRPLSKKHLVNFHETELRIDILPNNGRIYLLGAEDPDKIRGMYMDHVVLDEYQDKNYSTDFFEKIIRPLLSDRGGKAIITGTPAGKNQFYEMYQRGLNEEYQENWSSILMRWQDTNVLPVEEIRLAKLDMSEEAFMQEYECSFEAATQGSFFGKNISRLRHSGRIKDFQHDPTYPVIVGWDIGFDGTVVWFCQKVGEEIRIFDVEYFENKDLPFVCNQLLNKDYVYHTQLLPHDAVKRQIVDKSKTAKGQIESLGLRCKVVPKLPLSDGIHATRNLIDRAVFSKHCDKKLKLGRTKLGALDALSLYRAEYDDSKGVINQTPVHDRYSHIADALRTLAVGLKDNSYMTAQSQIDINKPGKYNQQLIENAWNPYRLRLGSLYTR